MYISLMVGFCCRYQRSIESHLTHSGQVNVYGFTAFTVSKGLIIIFPWSHYVSNMHCITVNENVIKTKSKIILNVHTTTDVPN